MEEISLLQKLLRENKEKLRKEMEADGVESIIATYRMLITELEDKIKKLQTKEE